MLIIADNAIPYLDLLDQSAHQLQCLPSDQITPQALKNAEALFVRTVTKVNRELLALSNIKFVGSMTAGFDHLDITWLEQNQIAWTYAPGCNSLAVTEYVLACIAWLQKYNYLDQKFRAGVIGVGHAGSLVAQALKLVGAEVLVNDPPRATIEKTFYSTDLVEFRNLDLVTLHVSLNPSSQKLINKNYLDQFGKCILINTARGEAIDENALLHAANITACLDVYPNEPYIDTALVAHALLSTPHIAGYSESAKKRATEMVLAAFESPGFKGHKNLPTLGFDCSAGWQARILNRYNPHHDSTHFKQALHDSDNVANCFLKLRANYPLRGPVFAR